MRKRLILSVAMICVTAWAAVASARDKGEMTLSLGLSHGTGEYGEPIAATGSDFIDTAQIGELGFNGEFARTMAPDYAMVFGFDYRVGSMKQEPTTNALPGTPEAKLTSSWWRIRLGGDRVGNIGDRFKWYMGPALEYASGKAKVEGGAVSFDTEPTNRYGINGRVGGVMMFNESTGVYGQIGNSLGMASVEDTGGKTSWYYSTFESAWGLQFAFGAK